MTIAIGLMFSMFMWDNQKFFGTAEKQVESGYSWEFVGKTESGVPLTVLDKAKKTKLFILN